MPHPSIRGIGIRYLLALTLPVTGVILVLYTVAQLFGFSLRDRRIAVVEHAPAITGSTETIHHPIPAPSYPNTSTKK
jgi:hypothetical protein